ncbi:uncharacterized protein LOC144659304 [Oculina patagonica]
MDLSSLLKIVIAYLLACVEVGSSWRKSTPKLWSLRSQFRHNKPCIGGSLIRIDTNQCEISPAGRRQCKAKSNGSSTRDPKTKFSFVKIRGRKCIQFTDDQDATKYALKVINGTNVTFEVHQCDSTTENSFLFVEERVGKLYQYKHRNINGTMQLCLPRNCDENLSLIRTNKLDRRCSYKKLKRK